MLLALLVLCCDESHWHIWSVYIHKTWCLKGGWKFRMGTDKTSLMTSTCYNLAAFSVYINSLLRMFTVWIKYLVLSSLIVSLWALLWWVLPSHIRHTFLPYQNFYSTEYHIMPKNKSRLCGETTLPSFWLKITVNISICVCVIYIYIYRQRERESKRKIIWVRK